MNTMPSAKQEPLEIFVKSGRLRIPTSFALPHSTLVLTASPGPCLHLFRPQEWDPIREKLLDYPMPDDPSEKSKISALLRFVLGNARDVEVSARSMIGIAEELATYAHIQGRLLWVPSTQGIELWSPSMFDPENHRSLFA